MRAVSRLGEAADDQLTDVVRVAGGASTDIRSVLAEDINEAMRGFQHQLIDLIRGVLEGDQQLWTVPTLVDTEQVSEFP